MGKWRVLVLWSSVSGSFKIQIHFLAEAGQVILNWWHHFFLTLTSYTVTFQVLFVSGLSRGIFKY